MNKIKTESSEIRALVVDLESALQRAFGDRCRAIYLMGSLSRGGFSEVASDIDVGLILERLVAGDGDQIQQVRARVAARYPGVSNNISIFWGSVPSLNGVGGAGRYPPFDRLDLIDHATLLSGIEVRDQLVRPCAGELMQASGEFALGYLAGEQRRQEFRSVQAMADKGVVYITKTILFPPRFIYLAEVGEVAGNRESCEFYREWCLARKGRLGAGAELVQQGYQWRVAGLPQSAETVVEALTRGLVPLYWDFLDLYIARLSAVGERDLAAQLQEWQADMVNFQH